MITAQNEAYGDPPPDPDVARDRQAYATGEIAILARDLHSGMPVGGGVCTVPYDRTTELAGVGVRAAYRRHGIAAALTARLAHEAHAAGSTTIFLMAAHEAEARIYERVGFTRISTVLHISQPPA